MVMNPKYQRYADRLSELIEEGQQVAKLEKPSRRVGRYIQGADKIKVQSWLTKVRSILLNVFGPKSPHYCQFDDNLPHGGVRNVGKSYEIYPIIGVLDGALDDLESGYLLNQEFLVAGEVFDSVINRARYLLENGYKDAAAILTRVVIEDALKRLTRSEGLDDGKKASDMNTDLWKNGRSAQTQWRFIQVWLDIGNAAAHGRFNEYDKEKVKRMMDDLESFLATEFGL